jgi:hypothetical protein
MSDDNAPAPGTKADLEAQLAAARAENENLRGQLAASGAGATGRAYQAPHEFILSEGDRQELELHGVANIGGRLMTRAEVLELLADSRTQSGVEIGEPGPEADRTATALVANRNAERNIRGVTFVYPSVADGLIDPAVAGTPGINGPAAGE